MKRIVSSFAWGLALAVALSMGLGAAHAAGSQPEAAGPRADGMGTPSAQLVCEVTYASETQVLRLAPSPDPYAGASIDLDKRFRFKAVATGDAVGIRHVSITVHELGKPGDAPAIRHQAHYSPSGLTGAVPALTGWQRVYASFLGRELRYGCAVQAVAEPASSPALPKEPLSAPPAASSWSDEPAPDAVRMAWMGDVMLADGPGRFIARGGDPFKPFAPLLARADLRVANLECVVAQGGKAIDKPWTFRASPKVLPLLKRHVDVVSLANNHSGDYGKAAFAEMLGRLQQAGLPQVGGGADLREAHRPLIIERKGLKIALLAYDDFFPRDFEAGDAEPGVAWAEDEQVVHDIRLAKAQADIVIPFMHWGQEHEPRANERQRALARLMIDAGADAVVGSHPHVVQDTEVYRGKPVIYSLGNFVFDGFSDVDNNTGWVLWMDVTRQGVTAWRVDVARIDRQGTPHPKAEAAMTAASISVKPGSQPPRLP